MQVRILKDIFQNDTYCDGLNNILKYFRVGKHRWLLDDYDDIDALNNSAWIKEINSRDLKIIKESIKASTRRDKARPVITVSDNKIETNFQLIEADKYLDQPLIVLLENSDYDPPFINAIIDYFDESGELSKAKNEQWLKYGMGGGSAVTSVIKGEIENSFGADCFTKPKNVYLRYFVILDSDKKYPSMSVDPSKVKTLDDYAVKRHVLYKREKENYIPIPVLRKLNDQYLNIYADFKFPEQKDYFDLEKGFNDKNRNSDRVDENIKKLYPPETVSDANWNILRKGIQLEGYKAQKFKTEFSKNFKDKSTNRESLLEMIKHQPKEGNLNEFEHIVNEIKKLL
jgi:hypothetical protein